MRCLFIFSYVIILLNSTLLAQKSHVQLKHIGELHTVKDILPDNITESSGLIFYRNKLWTHNDSGDEPCLYVMDTIGEQILQIVTIKNAKNNDWEDICQDKDFIYIGDFGNNFGQRNLLSIYKIQKKSIPLTGNCSVIAEVIQFSYKDMPLSSIIPQKSAFDCEAMVCFQDTLVLFSKNWEKPYCNVYCIPNKSGKYVISPKTSFFLEGLVTGASISPDGKALVLLGYKDYVPFVMLFKQFNINKITTKSSIFRVFDSELGYQTEGITFVSPSKAFISSETNKYRPNSLFTVNFW
jgi:hypothetical protein